MVAASGDPEVGGHRGAPSREGHQPSCAEGVVGLPQVDEPAVEVEQRAGVGVLGRHGRGLRVRLGRLPGLPGREPRSPPPCRLPLHRGPEARVGLVAGHPDLLPVVHEWQPGQGEQKGRRELRPGDVASQPGH